MYHYSVIFKDAWHPDLKTVLHGMKCVHARNLYQPIDLRVGDVFMTPWTTQRVSVLEREVVFDQWQEGSHQIFLLVEKI